MEAVEMKDLEVGWWGLFDALYGPEKVLTITNYVLKEPEGFGPYYGTGVKVLHFHVTDERGENPAGRFIVRAEHEPVMAMTYSHPFWTCAGCGATTGRYDSGEACETCVTQSFAESG